MTDDVLAVALEIQAMNDHTLLPVLADALEDAGYKDEGRYNVGTSDWIVHLREDNLHDSNVGSHAASICNVVTTLSRIAREHGRTAKIANKASKRKKTGRKTGGK